MSVDGGRAGAHTVTLREVTADTLKAVLRLAVSPAQAHDEHRLPEPETAGLYYLWRFMIDYRFQGLGYGRRGLELLIAHVRTRPHARRLLTSFVPGHGSPEGFYRQFGFTPTGAMNDGEVELELLL